MDVTFTVDTNFQRLFAGVLQFLMIGIITGDRRQGHETKFTVSPKNITVSRGEVAVLQCGIENLGTKSVIWRFLPYTVPLTIGKINFIDDERFQVHHMAYNDQWNLMIKNVQTHDAGVYECQVSSKRQSIRQNITLNVMDIPISAKPDIVIGGTRFVEKGGQIYLLCNATGHDYPPDAIDWFKDGIKLNDNDNNRIKIQENVLIISRTIISALEIESARMTDTGTYVCRISAELATRFSVDVLNAGTSNVKREMPRGGTHNNGGISSRYTSVFLFALTVLCVTNLLKVS
ncbi:hypothetical protein ScPMuIL_018405 [Solemya velum]